MQFLNWLVTSSADPAKFSTTVKALLLGVAPLAMLLFGWTDADFGQFADALSNLVFWTLSAISAVLTLVGLLRKVKLGRWAAQ